MFDIYKKPVAYADSINGGWERFFDECCALLPIGRCRMILNLDMHMKRHPDYTPFSADIGSAVIIFKNRKEQQELRSWLKTHLIR